jgi:glycerol-3-phosphate dehydrogenase
VVIFDYNNKSLFVQQWSLKTIRRIAMDVAEKVLEILRAESQPLNAGKIAELGGLDRKDVDKAMTKLKKEEKIVSPVRCYWTAA